MKWLTGLIIALSGAVTAADSQPGSVPADVRVSVRSNGDAAAGATKAAICAGCHGADGNAVAPIFPSLAAQSADYIVLQLRSFKNNWRTSPIMQPLAGALSDQDMQDLAAHFATLKRHPAVSDPTSEDADRGKTLYLKGDPNRGIPPCQGCHGADGAGLARSSRHLERLAGASTYPAVAGLSPDYIVAQLKAFRDGERSGTTNARIMQRVAQALDPQSEAVVAAYLATLAIE
jgi:cytochrome c553